MLFSPSLKTYLQAALLSGAVTALHLSKVPRADLAYEKVVSPEWYEPAVFLFVTFLGVMMAFTTPRPSACRTFVNWVGAKMTKPFFAAAGIIFGWAFTLSLFYAIDKGAAAFGGATVLAGYAVLFTVTPLWAFETVVPISKDYSAFRLRERRGLGAVRILGGALASYGALHLWMWLNPVL